MGGRAGYFILKNLKIWNDDSYIFKKLSSCEMSCVPFLKKNSVIFGPSYDVGIEYIVVGKNA